MELGNDLTLVAEATWYGMHYPTGMMVPTVKLPSFKFTSGTEF